LNSICPKADGEGNRVLYRGWTDSLVDSPALIDSVSVLRY
jgi:hypothetical protein